MLYLEGANAIHDSRTEGYVMNAEWVASQTMRYFRFTHFRSPKLLRQFYSSYSVKIQSSGNENEFYKVSLYYSLLGGSQYLVPGVSGFRCKG